MSGMEGNINDAMTIDFKANQRGILDFPIKD
jgi:hypothetical protein